MHFCLLRSSVEITRPQEGIGAFGDNLAHRYQSERPRSETIPGMQNCYMVSGMHDL